jgi:hypothetical protein
MAAARADGATGAVSALLLERAHLLLPLASHLSQGDHPAPHVESAIRGDSMAPAIPAGSRLRVRLGGQRRCRVGEVVFYLADGSYTVHRVVHRPRAARGVEYLLTAGDARFAPDPPVPSHNVLGTVIEVQIGGRWQPVGPQAPRPWPRRLIRSATLCALIITMWLSVAAADRLAAVLLALESRARVLRRRLPYRRRDAAPPSAAAPVDRGGAAT